MTRKRRCTHAATAKPQTRHTATTIQLCNYQSKLSNDVKVNVKKGKVQTYIHFICGILSCSSVRTAHGNFVELPFETPLLITASICHHLPHESHRTREPCSPPPRRLRSSREPDDDHQKSMDTSMLRSDPLHTRGSL